jgi:hypothetical protein
MKKTIVIIIMLLLILQIVSVSALSASDAKENWEDAKEASVDARDIHRDAKADFAIDNNEENKQVVIDTGKDSMHAALNEAEAWLIWKREEANEDYNVPEDIKEDILNDVETNLEKIDELRTDVDDITTQLELGLVFLKMVGKYVELVADVARNSGNVWVYIANEYADEVEEYEEKLRDGTDDSEVLDKLDMAKDELETARDNIDNAGETYDEVVIGGMPLIKFQEGNSYLRAAKANLISAHMYLQQAYALMVR